MINITAGPNSDSRTCHPVAAKVCRIGTAVTAHPVISVVDPPHPSLASIYKREPMNVFLCAHGNNETEFESKRIPVRFRNPLGLFGRIRRSISPPLGSPQLLGRRIRRRMETRSHPEPIVFLPSRLHPPNRLPSQRPTRSRLGERFSRLPA